MKHILYILLILTQTSLIAQENPYTSLHKQYDYVGCFDEDGIAKVGTKAYEGVIDKTGKIHLPFIYDKIEKIQNRYYKVEKESQKGIVDTDNKLIVPIQFEDITYVNNNLFIVKQHQKYGIIDSNQVWKLPCEYSNIFKYSNGYLLATKDTMKGILNQQMKWILKPIYEKVYYFYEDEIQHHSPLIDTIFTPYLHIEIKGKVGIIDTFSQTIIPCKYDYIDSEPQQDVWIVSNEQGYGLINTKGEVMVPFIYEDLEYDEINQSFIARDSLEKYGIIDNRGQIIEAFKYDYLGAYAKSLYVFEKDTVIISTKTIYEEIPDVGASGININTCKPKEDTSRFHIQKQQRYGILNISTHLSSKLYEDLDLESINGKMIFIAKKEGNVGVLTENGKELIPFVYDGIIVRSTHSSKNNDEFFRLNQYDYLGIANDEGKMIIEGKYDGIDGYSLGLGYLTLKKNNRYFLGDLKNGLLSNKAYEKIEKTNDRYSYPTTYFYITNMGKEGILMQTGKELIACKYDKIDRIGAYIFRIKDNHKKSIINTKGDILLPFIYDEIYPAGFENLFICEQSHKSGVIDSTGKIIIPVIYDYLDEMSYHPTIPYFVARKDTQFFYFDTKGNSIEEPYYPNTVSYHQRKGYGYIDETGIERIPFKYNLSKRISIREFDSIGLINLSIQAKEGIINTKNEIIVPIIYDRIDIHDKVIILQQKDKYGMIDKKGNSLLPIEYAYITKMESYYGMHKDGKLGLVNNEGKHILPCMYDNIINDNYPYFFVKQGYFFGLISNKNEQLIPFIYDELDIKMNDILIGKKNKTHICLHTNGKILLESENPIELRGIYQQKITYIAQNEDILLYGNQGKLLNKNLIVHNTINDGEYYIVSPYDKARAEKDKHSTLNDKINFSIHKFGLIDSLGNIVIPLIYDDMYYTHDGYLFATIGNRFYKLNKAGNSTIPEGYQIHNTFSNGLIAASKIPETLDEKTTKWGFLNEKGEIAIPMQYELVSDFYQGRAVVYQDKKCGIIDTNDKVIVPIIYEGLEVLYGGYAKAKIDCKFGILDSIGNPIIPIIYDFIEDRQKKELPLIEPKEMDKETTTNRQDLFPVDKEDYPEKRFYDNFIVMQDNLFGIVDKNGKTIIPSIYKEVKRERSKYFILKDTSNKFGLIDMNNKVIIPVLYNHISNFAGNIWKLQTQNTKFALYDIKNEKMIATDFQSVESTYDNSIIFTKQGKKYKADEKGNITDWDCEE